MARHDLPDGTENRGTLIDFREHLRRRVDRTTQDNDPQGPDPSTWETYRHAEYGDGSRPRFGRYDLLWLGMILVVGSIFWAIARH